MIKVCAHYCDTTIWLASFDKKEDANKFMENGFMLLEDDEQEYEDGYWIYPDEMFIEEDDEISFVEALGTYDIEPVGLEPDELPF